MSAGCAFATDMGVVRNMLAAVDCNTRHFATLGYGSLTGSALFQTALTICLTIYVALMGYRLMFAPEGMRLSDGPLLALKIGAIVALVSSWGVFQALVFDMADRAPLEIANVISAPSQDQSSLAADPIQGLQTAYDELSTDASSLGKSAAASQQVYANQKGEAAELLAVAAGVLFLGCAGLLAVSLIAIGVLTVVGPVFVTLLLFFETRGFFVGWIRALCGSAFALLSTWVLIVLMLHVFEPWLSELGQQRDAGSQDVQTAMTAAAIVFVFAASQLCVVLAGFVIAAGFSILPGRGRVMAVRQDIRDTRAPYLSAGFSRPAWLAEQLQRPSAFATYTRTSTSSAISRLSHAEPAVPGGTFARSFYRRPFLSRSAE